MMKIYRDVYVKGYKQFPYQKLKGRGTLLYTGTIKLGVDILPREYDEKKDFYFNCDCEFPKWKNLKKVFNV